MTSLPCRAEEPGLSTGVEDVRLQETTGTISSTKTSCNTGGQCLTALSHHTLPTWDLPRGTLMDSFAPSRPSKGGGGGAGGEAIHQQPLDAAACCSPLLLTCPRI